jgi:hypothetical protein
MSTNVVNMSPYLATSRKFPQEVSELAYHTNVSYVDVANAVNNRTISLFPSVRPAITGESWFLQQNQKQGGFRQAYPFTSTASITHNIVLNDLERMVRMYGSYTDGTNWYGLIGASTTAIAGQISFYMTPTQIVFVSGAGAPTLTKGTVILEWLSQP